MFRMMKWVVAPAIVAAGLAFAAPQTAEAHGGRGGFSLYIGSGYGPSYGYYSAPSYYHSYYAPRVYYPAPYIHSYRSYYPAYHHHHHHHCFPY